MQYMQIFHRQNYTLKKAQSHIDMLNGCEHTISCLWLLLVMSNLVYIKLATYLLLIGLYL